MSHERWVAAAFGVGLLACAGARPEPASPTPSLPPPPPIEGRYLREVFRTVEVESLDYAERDGRGLALDLYRPRNDPRADERIAILFVHGGGFFAGDRDEPRLQSLGIEMARRGFVFASITYRLLLEGGDFGCDQPVERKHEAIATAAEDVRAAAARLLARAEPVGFDRARLVLMGSSAGAYAVLRVAYPEPGDRGLEALAPFPRFAAVISFAGALTTLERIGDGAPAIPAQIVHSEDDPLVPYGEAIHHYCADDSPGALPLFGGGAIADRYEALGAPYELWTFCHARHDTSVIPIDEGRDEIASFIVRATGDEPAFQLRQRMDDCGG